MTGKDHQQLDAVSAETRASFDTAFTKEMFEVHSETTATLLGVLPRFEGDVKLIVSQMLFKLK